MNKDDTYNDKTPFNYINDHNNNQIMKNVNQFDSKFKNSDNIYDRKLEDHIIESEKGNNELKKVITPFNFNYKTTNNCNGNIYGNLTVNNFNLTNISNSKEQEVAKIFKDSFINLLGHYTSLTQSIINNILFKNDKKDINNEEKLKNEELKSTLACIINMQKNQQNQLNEMIMEIQQCKNILNRVNNYFKGINVPVKNPENIKIINDIK